jgi:predicted GH43/DUF377 family glycosyl hydrolase
MPLQPTDLNLNSIFPYHYCFNPAIIKISAGKYLLVCRLQNHPREGSLGLAYLNDQFMPIAGANMISRSPIHQPGYDQHIMMEDPRLISANGKIFIAYIESSPVLLFTTYVVMAEVVGLQIINPVVINYKNNRKAHLRLRGGAVDENIPPMDSIQQLPSREWIIEKNWQFFIVDGKHYFVYDVKDVHEVVQFNPATGDVIQVFKTQFASPWRYGRISGGASPVLFDDKFYSFFHSWTSKKIKTADHISEHRTYYMGVYLFEKTPPFRILQISGKPLVGEGKNLTTGPSGHSVVFPGSALFDNASHEWIIAVGWNDMAGKIIRLGQQDILQSLVNVKSLTDTQVKLRKYLQKLKRIPRYLLRRLR